MMVSKNYYMKNQINLLIAAMFISLLVSSCASLTGFEEGRTLGEENMEVGVSVNYTSVPDLFEDEIATDSINIGFPNIELNYKYGVTDKLDIGAKASTNLNVSTYAKYQLVGDHVSSFALAPGLEVGTIAGLGYSVGIPVYMSVYPTKNLAININPRFMYQFVTGLESSGVTYAGGNLGLLFGSKHKFGVDFGYYKIGGNGAGNNLLTFGIGGKFRFGDFAASESSDSSKKRRRKR